MTIPEEIIEHLKKKPRTAYELSLLLYNELVDPGTIHVHIHRARMIVPIHATPLDDGSKERGRPAVIYSLEKDQ